MKQRFNFIELMIFWLLLVIFPLVAAGWGWKAFIHRQSFYRQQQLEQELLNEAWYFQADLLPSNALDRLLEPIRDGFGFREDTSVEKRKWFEGLDKKSFRQFRNRVVQEVGCFPVCAVLSTGDAERTMVWWNKAYKPLLDDLYRLARNFRRLVFNHWHSWPSEKADRIGALIRDDSRRLFGPDGNLAGLQERCVEFVSHYHGFGLGYLTGGHGPFFFPGKNIPRVGHFVLLFHESDLNLRKIFASALKPLIPNMQRDLCWIEPASLPRLEKRRHGVSYMEALKMSPFQRQLMYKDSKRNPGKVPVVQISLPFKFCLPEELRFEVFFELTRCVWLLSGSFLILWLGIRGVPTTLTVKGRLAWGFLLALFPSMAGLFLLLCGWLFMRDSFQPQLAASALDRNFEIMDWKVKNSIDQQSRLAQGFKKQLQELEPLPETEAASKLESLLKNSVFDMGFAMFNSDKEILWVQPKARSDPGLVKLFQNLMRDFFRTKSGGKDSTKDSLLAKTLTEQFVDVDKMGRWLERGECLQRTPMGNVSQAILPLFLRKILADELTGMVFLKGFLYFTDDVLLKLIEDEGTRSDLGNGYQRTSLGYGYLNPAFPNISGRELFPSPEAREKWLRFFPLAKRSVFERVERSESMPGKGLNRELVKTKFLDSTYILGLGHAWETGEARMWHVFWGVGLMMLLLIGFWGMQRETGRFLARPLDVLLAALRSAASGDLLWRLNLRSHDEFGETADVFNQMAVKLIERERMSRFVSEDILDRVSGGDESAIQPGQGEKVETTVLVSDIRSFTTLSEQYPADMMVEMLNDYFTAMEAGIQKENGIIVSYIGDAIVAHFPNRPGWEDCSLRAVRAAWEMRQALKDLNHQRQSTGMFTIKTGIGLATGTLVSGVAGSTSGRLTQILLGDPVELATRLEVMTKKANRSGIMVDAETASRTAHAFRSTPLENEPEVSEIDVPNHIS